MTDEMDAANSPSEQDEELQGLMQGVPPRPEPTTRAKQQAYNTLKADWQAQTQTRRKRSRQRVWLTAVASFALVFIAVQLMPSGAPTAWQVELSAGSVTVDNVVIRAPSSMTLSAGVQVQSSQASRFVLPNGADLRLANSSQVAFHAANGLSLQAGEAYVDTHDRADIQIRTAFGEVRDIGTRFLVSVDEASLVVAVREGVAEVVSDHGVHQATAAPTGAALLHIDRSGVSSTEESAAHDRWEWIHGASAGYVSQSVPEVLQLIGRDLGKPIRYASRGVEATVASDTVQGDLTQVRPRKALELVTQSVGLQWRESADSIELHFPG